MRKSDARLSSLPLQVLVVYNRVFDVFFLVLGVLTWIYKGVVLPYPKHVLGLEIFGMLALFLVELARSYMGSKANKTQRAGLMFVFLIQSIICLVVHIYYLQWQTYVLRLDVIVYAFGIGFCGLEIILSIFSALLFWQHRRASF